MDLFGKHTRNEIHRTLVNELAKASSEIKRAQRDIDSVKSRLGFCLAATNDLIKREDDNGSD